MFLLCKIADFVAVITYIPIICLFKAYHKAPTDSYDSAPTFDL